MRVQEFAATLGACEMEVMDKSSDMRNKARASK